MTYPAAKLRGTNRAAIATSISSLAKSVAVYFVAVSIDTAIIAENNMDADIQENPHIDIGLFASLMARYKR